MNALILTLALAAPGALPQSTLKAPELPQSTLPAFVPFDPAPVVPEPIPAPAPKVGVCPCPCDCADGVCTCDLNCDCPDCPARGLTWVRSDHPGYLSLVRGDRQVGVYEIATESYYPESQRAAWSRRRPVSLPLALPGWFQGKAAYRQRYAAPAGGNC